MWHHPWTTTLGAQGSRHFQNSGDFAASQHKKSSIHKSREAFLSIENVGKLRYENSFLYEIPTVIVPSGLEFWAFLSLALYGCWPSPYVRSSQRGKAPMKPHQCKNRPERLLLIEIMWSLLFYSGKIRIILVRLLYSDQWSGVFCTGSVIRPCRRRILSNQHQERTSCWAFKGGVSLSDL